MISTKHEFNIQIFERRLTMPEFCNPFSVLKNDRNVTHEELVRAIRFMIAAVPLKKSLKIRLPVI